MLLKKTALLAAAMTLGASTAWAANSSSTQINISATVPSTTFHALPVDPNFGQAEVMAYDFGLSKILDIRQRFNFKSTAGALRAYIDGGPRPLFNGTPAQNIPLTTQFNGVTLTATPTEVVNAAGSTAGGNADLVISAGAIPANAGGDYSTSFTVMFDSTPP